MLNTTTFLFKTATERHPQFGEEYRVSGAARRLYRQAQARGRFGAWWNAVRANRTGHRLPGLEAVIAQRPVGARAYAGLQTVSLSRIRGSVGRCGDDFDASFRPLAANTEQRWLRVATAREEGLGLPPVQLIQVGEAYFVQDGHHRVSVARARGEQDIEAEVTVWNVA